MRPSGAFLTYKAVMNQGDKLDSDVNPLAFLMGGGEMGSLIRSMDWAATSLGPVAGWPQSLRTTISICLASDLPICVIWGPGLVQLYNDAYRVICGSKHPRSMGQNFAACWAEAWPVIGAAHDSALAGDTAFLESQQIFLERHGYVEECFFTFSFSPIRDEAGRVGGLFHPVIEMTAQMISERRTRTLRDLTAQIGKAKSVDEVLAFSAQTLAAYQLDLPFTLLYALDRDGDQVRLIGEPGATVDATPGRPDVLPWPLDEVIRSGNAVQVDGLEDKIGTGLPGPYPEAPTRALALPIILQGVRRPIAVMVAGVSARLPMNEAYRSFYDALAAALATGVVNAVAFDDERRRAKALAELDRAKIAFFSNVSHEFRTPLTLILGPIEDLLTASNRHLLPSQHEQLEVAHRNGLRLQRLVNGLLEFSRIEAGRARAAYEPTALADFTADLASNFRSACEKAGLALRVDCPPLSEQVFVDRMMWETIVLNLLSNAFKFTFAGAIDVSLRQAGSAVELRVTDSGIGIPAGEIPLLFERFHRVENALGRTHEGSGIGLALVHELAKLHGGAIGIQSELGQGTTFTVSIPLGSQHLPQEHLGNARARARHASPAQALTEEALRWIGAAADDAGAVSEFSGWNNDVNDARPRVLIADDNADMRRYVARTLEKDYRIEAVADGAAALAAARARTPDLVLTDVMMPQLDGFGLLHALRADARTAAVPVIMLSARAGEDSRIDGMREGADDYLVKPFSGRELLARVAAHLQMARIRRESMDAIHASEAQFRALVNASSDAVYRMNPDWTELRHLRGREFIANTDEPNQSWLKKYIFPADQARVLETIKNAISSKGNFELEHRVMRVDGTLGWTFSRAVPLLDNRGNLVEWLGMASDITARKQAREALERSEQKYRTLFESMDQGYCVVEMLFDAGNRPADYQFLEVNPGFAKHTGLQHARGKRMQEIAWDEQSHWCATFGQVARTGTAVRFEDHAAVLGGRWVDVYAFRLGEHGSNKVALLISDISERKRDGLERERLVTRLREEDQRKDEFLATLAHELRNPLAPIRNGLQIMRLAQGDTEKIERIRVMMDRQVGQMVHLIDDLLDLSRISHGKIDLRKQRIDLAEAIGQAIEASRPFIAQSDHELLIKFPAGPIHVEADSTRLAQVFSNLLNNAAKFTDRGGLIRVTVQQQDAEAIVSIHDNGVGIPAAMLTHVFDMFTQIDSKLGVPKGGLGIGLSIVKRLVEMHDGTIEVRSGGLGMGSEFIVRLPLALGLSAEVPAPPAAVLEAATRHRILVVDDNVDSADTLAMFLAMMGNVTAIAHDGQAALERAVTFSPDVIFLDIGMPGLNGYEVSRRLRQEQWGKDIVLIALTGWGQEDDKRQSSEAGFDFHLTKPVVPEDVEKMLDQIAAMKRSGTLPAA
jgi:signal transduction histidine kinase/DNA-binding response OmpR family regulator